MPADAVVGFTAGSSNGADPSNALEFFFRRAMAMTATATLVKVVAVYKTSAVAVAGVVDVQLLVSQIDGQGNITVRPIVYGVPYGRVQSGTDAIIMDPKVGDIGVCCFGDRDLSAVIASQAQSAPGSNRRNSLADALYVCSVLGTSVPTQFVQFQTSGITVKSPTKVTIIAPANEIQGPLHVTGAVTADSTIVATGDVTGAGISLQTHVHGGVQTGSGDSGPPV